jgi:hypothetical protein
MEGPEVSVPNDTLHVAKWDVFELALTGPADGNPFVDVQLSARFSLGSRTVSVEGFYDGDGTYRIRFMPDEVGEWSYRTESSDQQLAGAEGSFTCAPANGLHGPVRVARTYGFAHADGTPYRPFGTTCYAWTHQPKDVREQTLATLGSSPFNKVRMCVFPKSFSHNTLEPQRYPFPVTSGGSADSLVFDSTQFDTEFFQELDHAVEALRGLGIEADVILFHPYDRWGFSALSDEDDERYLRYVNARLGAYCNVWWSLANEFDALRKDTERWDRAFQVLVEHDAFDHLRSIHNFIGFYDHTKPWVTHVSVQQEDPRRISAWRQRYGKPVIVDECGYEGDLEDAWGNLTAQEMAHRVWAGTMAGGYVTHGETYLQPETVGIWWSHGSTLRGESPSRIRFLRGILDDAPAELEPLTSTIPYRFSALGPTEDVAARDLFGDDLELLLPADRQEPASFYPVLRAGDDYYLIYFGAAQPSRFTLFLPPGSYQTELIDTWAMTIAPLATVTSGAVVELPARPYQALRVTAAGAGS